MANEIYAVFDTTEGKFKIRLFAAHAPARWRTSFPWRGNQDRKPFYDGTIFIA